MNQWSLADSALSASASPGTRLGSTLGVPAPAPSLLILDLFCARNLFLNGMGDGPLFMC